MRVTVSKEDIRHNYRLLKERAGVPVIPVLKAIISPVSRFGDTNWIMTLRWSRNG